MIVISNKYTFKFSKYSVKFIQTNILNLYFSVSVRNNPNLFIKIFVMQGLSF